MTKNIIPVSMNSNLVPMNSNQVAKGINSVTKVSNQMTKSISSGSIKSEFGTPVANKQLTSSGPSLEASDLCWSIAKKRSSLNINPNPGNNNCDFGQTNVCRDLGNKLVAVGNLRESDLRWSIVKKEDCRREPMIDLTADDSDGPSFKANDLR